MKKLSQRWIVRVISFSIAIFLVFLGAGISGYLLTVQYKATIENAYRAAVNELTGYVDNIMDTLKKGMYANTSTNQVSFAITLLSHSENAKQVLERLPLEQNSTDGLQKFLSQSSDFASYMINKLASGEKLSQQDSKTIKTLREYAEILNNSMSEIVWRYGDGTIELAGISNNMNNICDARSGELCHNAVTDGFESMNDSFRDYPTLLYDGPFADHIMQKHPQLLENAKEVSEKEAQVLAAEFLGINDRNISFVSERKGNVPSYLFQYKKSLVSVTKQGGVVEYFYCDSSSGVSIKKEDAVILAREFLRLHGFNNVKESYYICSDGICTVNFAKTIDDVVCYSDLLKVGVALSSGEIVYYNATGYIMNSHPRDLPYPTLTQQQAQKRVSPLLDVESCQLALIPLSDGKEVLCYEFKCTSEDDETLLVYINVGTGEEENIFILMQSDNGVLAV